MLFQFYQKFLNFFHLFQGPLSLNLIFFIPLFKFFGSADKMLPDSFHVPLRESIYNPKKIFLLFLNDSSWRSAGNRFIWNFFSLVLERIKHLIAPRKIHIQVFISRNLPSYNSAACIGPAYCRRAGFRIKSLNNPICFNFSPRINGNGPFADFSDFSCWSSH